jgi:tRNA-dihydrouridine synthase B
MAPSNPWIFRQIDQYCSHRERDGDIQPDSMNSGLRSELKPHAYDHPAEADRYQMIRTYFQMLIEEELPDAVGKMKQFASWFTHGVPGGAALRKAIYESKNAPDILLRVEVFIEARLQLCAADLA